MKTTFALICLVLAPLLWAGNFVVGRALGGVIDPLVLNWLRWLIAGALLLPVLVYDRRAILAALISYWRPILLLSLLGVVLFNWVLYAGLQTASASLAGLVFGLTPILILAVARGWNGRALGWAELAGGAVALGGVGLVVAGNGGVAAAETRGVPAVLAAAAIWAVYTVALKRCAVPLSALSALAVSVWIGLIVMTPMAAFNLPRTIFAELSVQAWAAALYLGVAASVIAFVAWQTGVRMLGAARSAIFMQLIPVFGVLLAAAVLNEPVGAYKTIGLLLVIGGVLLAQRPTA